MPEGTVPQGAGPDGENEADIDDDAQAAVVESLPTPAPSPATPPRAFGIMGKMALLKEGKMDKNK